MAVRFTRQGQSCTAASRIYVHDEIFEEFVSKMKQKIDALKMGDPQSEETDIGTVITAVSHNINQRQQECQLLIERLLVSTRKNQKLHSSW